MSDPKLIGEGLSAETMATLRKIGDGKIRPTGPNGRMRYCTRCDRLAHEFEKIDPAWLPPLAHSWVSNGRRYWTDLCSPCLAFEKRRREAMRADTHNEDGGPKATLGMRPARSWGHWQGDR